MLSISGIVVLTATKFADALTTVVGVRYIPGVYEANPVVDAVLHEVGVGYGLLVSSVVVIVAIALITEASALTIAVRRRDGHLAPIVRAVGYGLPSIGFTLISLYNVQILLQGIELGGVLFV